ncbi:MAG TPA: hypothetical protein VHY09_02795 [Candidatus Methylacidiphilales bacterium]|jgi:hypothetical protein|nr:hypothetical protein [Candidatus Methylacidiphilales bacterium]
MKLLSELSVKETIELLAATLFRVWGFDYALNAFSALWHLKSYYEYTSAKPPFTAYDWHMFFNYSFDVFFDSIVALLMFFASLGLARLVTRGLFHSLQKNSNTSS